MNRQQGKPIKIAVVGDVHDQWEAKAEAQALKQLGVDLVLLVGDFGNEAVEVVRAIAHLDLPKAVILGNHDAWYTASDWGRKQCPYDPSQEDRVQQQLDLLGETHVGYGQISFPALQLSVVGGRPFSWGGSVWKNHEFYQKRYGVRGFAESADRIVAAASETDYPTVIFLGHCGPTGLGEAPEAPCGKDWEPIGGDHGDPDFEQAITRTRQLGKTVSLVTFGHMHHHLRHTKSILRTAVQVDAAGTVYLNAARVPRIVKTADQTVRNFSIVTLASGQVSQVVLVWVNPEGQVTQEEQLFSRSTPERYPVST